MGKVIPFPRCRLGGNPWPGVIQDEWQPLLERLSWIPGEDDGVVSDYAAWRCIPAEAVWAALNTYTHIYPDAPLQ